jgi:transposase
VKVPKLDWQPCTDSAQKGFQCATARVPLNYATPTDARSISRSSTTPGSTRPTASARCSSTRPRSRTGFASSDSCACRRPPVSGALRCGQRDRAARRRGWSRPIRAWPGFHTALRAAFTQAQPRANTPSTSRCSPTATGGTLDIGRRPSTDACDTQRLALDRCLPFGRSVEVWRGPVFRTPDRLRRQARQEGCTACPRPGRRIPGSSAARRCRCCAAGARRASSPRRWGCPSGPPRNWRRQDERDPGERDDGLTSDERDELRRLRHGIARLKQERDLRKRAAAFFAAETETRDCLPDDLGGEGHGLPGLRRLRPAGRQPLGVLRLGTRRPRRTARSPTRGCLSRSGPSTLPTAASTGGGASTPSCALRTASGCRASGCGG